jgi:hypothetical protein
LLLYTLRTMSFLSLEYGLNNVVKGSDPKSIFFYAVCFFHQKANPSKALHLLMKRSLDLGCIMEPSGEPVSKYRVMVYVSGRPE